MTFRERSTTAITLATMPRPSSPDIAKSILLGSACEDVDWWVGCINTDTDLAVDINVQFI